MHDQNKDLSFEGYITTYTQSRPPALIIFLKPDIWYNVKLPNLEHAT